MLAHEQGRGTGPQRRAPAPRPAPRERAGRRHRPARRGPGPARRRRPASATIRSSRGRSTPCAETDSVRSRSADDRDSREVPSDDHLPRHVAHRVEHLVARPRGAGRGLPRRRLGVVQGPPAARHLEGQHRRDPVLARLRRMARADHARQPAARHPPAGDIAGREPRDDRPRSSNSTGSPCASACMARPTSALPAHFVDRLVIDGQHLARRPAEPRPSGWPRASALRSSCPAIPHEDQGTEDVPADPARRARADAIGRAWDRS